jgi:hypothetical protein
MGRKMRVLTDDLWFCEDCTMVAVNGDYTGLDYSHGEEEAAKCAELIDAGLDALGPGLCCGDDEEEFSTRWCDCCGTHLAGRRQQFLLLGE